MALEKMLLFAFLVLIAVRHIKPQVVQCVEDVNCMDGFFCVERMQICRECLRCGNLGRSPSSIQRACIKSAVQCGPCLQGLVNDGNWDEKCITPNTRSWKLMSSHVWILVAGACGAVGALLFIGHMVHGIWNIHTHVDIEISAFTKVKHQTELTV